MFLSLLQLLFHLKNHPAKLHPKHQKSIKPTLHNLKHHATIQLRNDEGGE